jgi:hypothetical protein
MRRHDMLPPDERLADSFPEFTVTQPVTEEMQINEEVVVPKKRGRRPKEGA